MLVLKSLPLSLSVFWRFLVVMPIFLPIAAIVVIAFSVVMPFLAGVFLQIAISFSVMLALRGAYQAKAVSGASVFGKLFGAALKWAGFDILVYAIIGFGIGLALWLAAELDGQELSAVLEDFDAGSVLAVITASPFVTGVAAIGILLLYGLSVAFMVPKAAAAYAAGSQARAQDFFAGFGEHFFSLAVVLVASYAVSIFSGAVTGTIEVVTLAIQGLQGWWTGKGSSGPETAALIRIALLVLVQIWSFCWVYAAAALAFLDHLGRAEAVLEAERIVPVSDPEELRALRKSRQPSP